MAKVLNVEVVVVGGGPAGLTAAIALAGAGIIDGKGFVKVAVKTS